LYSCWRSSEFRRASIDARRASIAVRRVASDVIRLEGKSVGGFVYNRIGRIIAIGVRIWLVKALKIHTEPHDALLEFCD
jgi:hypothetical protein